MFSLSCTVGVDHGDPVETLTDMRRVDGASRDINRPAGVAFCFQISGNSVEPTIASVSRNLLSHDDSGPAGTDEAKEVGPQMPFVVGAFSFAGDAERLAGTGSAPQGPIVGPSCLPRCDGPHAASGEEMRLREFCDVGRFDVGDRSSVNNSCRKDAILDETFEDVRRCGFDFIIIGTQIVLRAR